MKQKVSIPAAVAIVVVVAGGLSLFLYRHYMVTPGASGDKPVSFNNAQVKPMSPPHTKEEGLAFYRNAIGGGKK